MDIEIRSDHVIIKGYVNAVDRDSRVLPRSLSPKATSDFVERVTPKTFERALSRALNVEVRYNHGKVVGSTGDGNTKLYEDNIGLYAETKITDQTVIEKARNNELRGWSFGFVANSETWTEASEGLQRRSLDDIELREVTILDKTPAYIGTSIEMRGEDCHIYEERVFEETPTIIDNTPKPSIDLSNQKAQVEILKMRGR